MALGVIIKSYYFSGILLDERLLPVLSFWLIRIIKLYHNSFEGQI